MAESRHLAATLAMLSRIVAGAGRGYGAIVNRLRAGGGRTGRLAASVRRVMAGSALSGLVAPFIATAGGSDGDDPPPLAASPPAMPVAAPTAMAVAPYPPVPTAHAPATAWRAGAWVTPLAAGARHVMARATALPTVLPAPLRAAGLVAAPVAVAGPAGVPASIPPGRVVAMADGFRPVPAPSVAQSVAGVVMPGRGGTGAYVTRPALSRMVAAAPLVMLARQAARAGAAPVLMRAGVTPGGVGDMRLSPPVQAAAPAGAGWQAVRAGGGAAIVPALAGVAHPAMGVPALRAAGPQAVGPPAFHHPGAGAAMAAYRPETTRMAVAALRPHGAIPAAHTRMIVPPPMGGQAAWRPVAAPGVMAGADVAGPDAWPGRPAFISPPPQARPDMPGHGGGAPGGPAPVVQVTIPLRLDHHVLGQAVARIDTNQALHAQRASGTAPDVMQYPQVPGRSIGR